MFITNRIKIQAYILMLLAVFLLMRILQVIHYEGAHNPKEEVKVNFLLLSHSPSCNYRTPEYQFELPGCDQLALGSKVVLFGTVATRSDTAVLQQKSLMNVRVMQERIRYTSVKHWFSIVVIKLLRVKMWLLESLIGLVPVESQSLLISLIFGETQLLSETERLLFKTTGTQHLLAASGYNVGMIAQLLQSISGRRRSLAKSLCTLCLIWLYALYAGLGASILRATIMYSLSILASTLHRAYSPIWALGVTGYFMIFFTPWYLADIGFQLSMAATASILFGLRKNSTSVWKAWATGDNLPHVVRPSSSWLTTIKEYWLDSLRVSWWAMVGTLPLVLYHFEESSLWSVIATGAVAWLMPSLMMGGLLLGGLAMVADVLRFTFLTYLVQLGVFGLHLEVTLFISLLSLFTTFPEFVLRFQGFTWWMVGISWGMAVVWRRWRQRRFNEN